MRYRVRHVTRYDYASTVSLSHNQVKLSPRVSANQLVTWPQLTVDPEPNFERAWVDGFGNRTHFFSIEHPHKFMQVLSESVVDRSKPSDEASGSVSWELLAHSIRRPTDVRDIEATPFLFDSRYAAASDAAKEYAAESFVPNRSVYDVAIDLMQRIFKEFKYAPNATSLSTPTSEVLKERRGVCQDFAHLQIACFRSMGIPSRYVSGYLLTHPPAGQPKLVGSDASHAWVSVYLGEGKWLDLDPTNNLIPADEHITIGWGRDYADVSPIQGVLIGAGQSVLKVSVDVTPID